MKVDVSPEAIAYLTAHGRRLFVWTSVTRCCSGPLTFLDAATEPPRSRREFRRMPGETFDLFLDIGHRSPPDEIHVEIKGWRTKKLRAYWNGCAYAVD